MIKISDFQPYFNMILHIQSLIWITGREGIELEATKLNRIAQQLYSQGTMSHKRGGKVDFFIT